MSLAKQSDLHPQAKAKDSGLKVVAFYNCCENAFLIDEAFSAGSLSYASG